MPMAFTQADMSAPSGGEAAGLQRFLEVLRKILLHQNLVWQPLMMETRRIDGGLRGHAQAHPVDDAEQRGGNDRRPAGRAGDEAELSVAGAQW